MSEFDVPAVPPLEGALRERMSLLPARDGITITQYYDMLREWVRLSPRSWQLGLQVGLPSTYLIPKPSFWSEDLQQFVLKRVFADWHNQQKLLQTLQSLCLQIGKCWTETSLTKAIGACWACQAIIEYSKPPLAEEPTDVPQTSPQQRTDPRSVQGNRKRVRT